MTSSLKGLFYLQVPESSTMDTAGFYLDLMHNAVTLNTSGFATYFIRPNPSSLLADSALCSSTYLTSDQSAMYPQNMYLAVDKTGVLIWNSNPDAGLGVRLIHSQTDHTEAYVYVDTLGYVVPSTVTCPAQSPSAVPGCQDDNGSVTYYQTTFVQDQPPFAYKVTPYYPVFQLGVFSSTGLMIRLAAGAANTWSQSPNDQGVQLQLLNDNLFVLGSESFAIDPKTNKDATTAVALLPAGLSCPKSASAFVPPTNLQLQTASLGAGFSPSQFVVGELPNAPLTSPLKFVFNLNYCGATGTYNVGFDASKNALICSTADVQTPVYLFPVSAPNNTVSLLSGETDAALNSLLVVAWPQFMNRLPVLPVPPTASAPGPSSATSAVMPPWAWAIIGIVLVVIIFCAIYFPLKNKSERARANLTPAAPVKSA